MVMKISFEEFLKLSKEERIEIVERSHSLNEGERFEVDNPISKMTFEEAQKYLRGLGCIPVEEVARR